MKIKFLTLALIIFAGLAANAALEQVPDASAQSYRDAATNAVREANLNCKDNGATEIRIMETIAYATKISIDRSGVQPAIILESGTSVIIDRVTLVTTADYKKVVSAKWSKLLSSEENIGTLIDPVLRPAYIVDKSVSCEASN